MKARFIDLQKKRLIKGEISRRQFIRSALASGLGVSGAMTIATAAEAERPSYGGTLRIGLRGHDLPFAFGSALTELQADGSLIGELAESWESDSLAQVWRFQLRRGVTFHSGQTLTAEDAARSLAALSDGLLRGMTEIRADGDAVALQFAAPVPDLPLWLADPLAVIRAADGALSGPYRPDTGERFADWFKAERAPFDALVLVQDAALTDLTEGRVDLISGAEPEELAVAAELGLIAEAQTGTTRRLVGGCGDLVVTRLNSDWAERAGCTQAEGMIAVPDLTIRRAALTHGSDVGRDLPLDGLRVAERWWFS